MEEIRNENVEVVEEETKETEEAKKFDFDEFEEEPTPKKESVFDSDICRRHSEILSVSFMQSSTRPIQNRVKIIPYYGVYKISHERSYIYGCRNLKRPN